jgi:hypothetical protein
MRVLGRVLQGVHLSSQPYSHCRQTILAAMMSVMKCTLVVLICALMFRRVRVAGLAMGVQRSAM